MEVPVPSARDCVKETLSSVVFGTVHGRSWPDVAPLLWSVGALLVAVGHTHSTPSGDPGGSHHQPRAVYKYWARLRRQSCGRLREHAAQLPAVHADRTRSASDSIPRQSVGHPCYATETGTHSANCAEYADSTAQFLGRQLTRPLFLNDRCRAWFSQC